jgi:3-hydroxypropanoate dehydrogenase
MSDRLSPAALNSLFREARTYGAWQEKQVPDELLRELYDLMKWGPTSANLCPARVLFLRTREAKERLRPALSPGNVDKTMAAPVTAIVAYDELFFEQAQKLWPPNPAIAEVFANSPELAEKTALRNGSLQGAYLILAARSLGLDCGPMSGFDNDKVDAEFFPPPSEDKPTDQVQPLGRIRSNFLCNLGYGDPGRLHPRNPRLEFEEACRLL